MIPDEDLGSMDADTSAYFESRGEKIPEAPPAPASAEAPEDTDADAAAAAAVEGKPDPMVPLRAVTREREEKKQLRDSLAEMERKYAVLTDRWDTMLKGAQPQPTPTPQIEPPDPDKDIFAALKYEREQRAALEAKINGREQQEQEAAKLADFEAKVDTFWKQDVQQYATANPDFKPAATWLAEARDKQLQALGVADPRMRDPQWRNRVIDAEVKQVIVAAAQQGRSPAEMFYEIAKSWGYTPKAAEPPAAGAIADLAKNADAEISLSAANGSRQPASPDAETIANMSPDQFEKWLSKNGTAGFRKIAG